MYFIVFLYILEWPVRKKVTNTHTHTHIGGGGTSGWIAIPRHDYRCNGVKINPRNFERQQTARQCVRTLRAALYHKGVERLRTVKGLTTRYPATSFALHALLWLLRWDQASQTGPIRIIVRFRWRIVFARRSSSWVLPHTGPLWQVINICNRIEIYILSICNCFAPLTWKAPGDLHWPAVELLTCFQYYGQISASKCMYV